MQTVFTAIADGPGSIFVPENAYFAYSVTDTFVATIKFQYSDDGGATWTDAATETTAGVAYIKATADWYVRVICSAFTSGQAVVTLYNAAGATLAARYKPFTVDYVWAFTTDGGAVTDITLYPSKVIPAGSLFFSLTRRITTAIGGAGDIGLGYDGNAGGLEADSKGGNANEFKNIADGCVSLDAVDVAANITSAILTDGVIVWTLNGITPDI